MSPDHEPLPDELLTDPNDLLFGEPHEDYEHTDGAPAGSRRSSRAHRKRVRRHRRAFTVGAIVIVAVIALVSYLGYSAYQDRYHPKDFSGAGTGEVVVTVHSGDSASTIGKTLESAGVVASVRAFSNAAADNSNSEGISAGTYKLHKQMSATAAIALLLDPTARLSESVAVFEGATVLDVEPALATSLQVPQESVAAALKDVSQLGLPSGYTSGSSLPSSVEGFLYPATYTFDPGTKPADAIQAMITKFIDEDRGTGFAAKAKKLHLTPYAALIIASIAEKEAKNPDDFAKVARVVLNRIAADMPLQIDATSAYAGKLAGLDPTKVIYNQIDSPYNTYQNDGLPPTPIASPGATAMNAAVNPASGNWLYYVNKDKAGNLFFTNDPDAFEVAVQKCRDNNWGCG